MIKVLRTTPYIPISILRTKVSSWSYPWFLIYLFFIDFSYLISRVFAVSTLGWRKLRTPLACFEKIRKRKQDSLARSPLANSFTLREKRKTGSNFSCLQFFFLLLSLLLLFFLFPRLTDRICLINVTLVLCFFISSRVSARKLSSRVLNLW